MAPLVPASSTARVDQLDRHMQGGVQCGRVEQITRFRPLDHDLPEHLSTAAPQPPQSAEARPVFQAEFSQSLVEPAQFSCLGATLPGAREIRGARHLVRRTREESAGGVQRPLRRGVHFQVSGAAVQFEQQVGSGRFDRRLHDPRLLPGELHRLLQHEFFQHHDDLRLGPCLQSRGQRDFHEGGGRKDGCARDLVVGEKGGLAVAQHRLELDNVRHRGRMHAVPEQRMNGIGDGHGNRHLVGRHRLDPVPVPLERIGWGGALSTGKRQSEPLPVDGLAGGVQFGEAVEQGAFIRPALAQAADPPRGAGLRFGLPAGPARRQEHRLRAQLDERIDFQFPQLSHAVGESNGMTDLVAPVLRPSHVPAGQPAGAGGNEFPLGRMVGNRVRDVAEFLEHRVDNGRVERVRNLQVSRRDSCRA